MPKQENTAINHLIGFVSQRPIDADEPALFDSAPPAARLRSVPFGGNLAPIGAAVAPLPRRRAPAATPPQVPRQPIYSDDDDAETTIGAPPQWEPIPSLSHAAGSYTVDEPDTGPFAPQPLPAAPQVGYAYPAAQPGYMRPDYPPPHAPPAYYQVPYAEHLDTMRVRALPLEPDASLGREVLATMARFWMPFAALGVIALALAGYRVVKGDEPTAAPMDEAPIVMAAVPAEVTEPVQESKSPLAAAIVGDRLDVEPAAAAPIAVEPVAVAPVAPDPDAVPADSPWQPTRPQPTIAPIETAAAVESVAAELEGAATPAARPSASKATKERSQSRSAKRAAAKRARQLAEAAKPAKRVAAPVPAEPKVVAIAAAKPMKIGASTVAPAASGHGKLAIASTPSTLIYVDGRNTGMMTPKTLSLPAGSHKITLLSPKDRIAKTISVEIESGKSAKVSKDFAK